MNDRSRPKAAPDNLVTTTLPAGVDIARGLTRAAVVYALAGWPVFPCKTGGKAPLTAHGFKDASTDLDQVRAWWKRWPTANIATPTGIHYDVVDVDVRADGNGWDALYRLQRTGLLRGCIATAGTRNGGLHLFYPASGRRGGVVAPWLDFKGAGGYVLLAPSRVPADDGINGSGRYGWDDFGDEAEGSPFDFDRAQALLTPPKPQRETPKDVRNIRKTPGGVDGLLTWLGGQREGNRNKALFWAARKAAGDGMTDQSTGDQLVAVAVDLGLGLEPSAATVASGFEHGGRTR